LVASEGAHHVIDHGVPGYIERVNELTDQRGVDIILEMLANVNLARDLSVLAPGGRVVIIGSRGKIEIAPRELMTREADVRGMLLFNVPPVELARIHAALRAGLENGTLRPIVGREMPLAEAAAAHRAVLDPGAYGKIVLVP
jgi:NADPH2:quinone reductase